MLANKPNHPKVSNLPLAQQPDANGRFGQFGGKYVPETLMSVLKELEAAFEEYRNDPEFKNELQGLLLTALDVEIKMYKLLPNS